MRLVLIALYVLVAVIAGVSGVCLFCALYSQDRVIMLMSAMILFLCAIGLARIAFESEGKSRFASLITKVKDDGR